MIQRFNRKINNIYCCRVILNGLNYSFIMEKPAYLIAPFQNITSAIFQSTIQIDELRDAMLSNVF